MCTETGKYIENNHKFRKFAGNPPADVFLIIWKLPEMWSAWPACVHALHQKANKIINWENKPFFQCMLYIGAFNLRQSYEVHTSWLAMVAH